MNKTKLKNYTTSEKLIFDWTDKKKYPIHYKILKIPVRHGMVVEKNS